MNTSHSSIVLKRVISWMVIVCLLVEQTIVLAEGLPTGFRTIRGAGSYTEVGNVGTIKQGSSRAIYGWDTFNIAKGNTVNFRQNPGDIALNRIFDQSPSEIFGNLNADATIYLINPNGIIFGENGRISVGSLTASTLDAVSDDIFMGSSLDGSEVSEKSLIKAISSSKAAFQTSDGSSSNTGQIKIEAGAEITSRNASGQMYIGEEIVNSGTLTAKNGGQIIMAAAKDKVYLAEPSTNSELRGVIVEVNDGGKITNNGVIKSERGNITLAGLAINQNGRINATTTVSSAGSIRLQARDTVSLVGSGSYTSSYRTARGGLIGGTASTQAPVGARGGEIVFGKNSVTDVIADANPGEASSGLVQSKPAVEAIAKTIKLDKNALISARGGRVELVAAANTELPDEASADTSASIVMEKGARIDVSGMDSSLTIDKSNLVIQRVTGTTVADSPVQRRGELRDKKVYVPLRNSGDIDIINVEGDLAAVNRTLSQRLAKGGSVTLKTAGGFVQKNGSKIDIGGGQSEYSAGKLITNYVRIGRSIIPLYKADKNIKYDELTYIERNLSGFFEGHDAGNFSLEARQALFAENGILAGTTIGTYQRHDSPSFGSIDIDLTYSGSVSDSITVVGAQSFRRYFDESLKNYLTAGTLDDLVLSDQLAVGGISELSLTAARPVTVASDAKIKIHDGGSLSISGQAEYLRVIRDKQGCEKSSAANCVVDYLDRAGVKIDGDIRIAGGEISLNSVLDNTGIQQTNGDSLPDNKTEKIAIDQRTSRNGSNAAMQVNGKIDVSGNFVNDIARSSTKKATIMTDGGSIDLSADGDIELSAPSSLLANAGMYYKNFNNKTYGKGGLISLTAANPTVVLNTITVDDAPFINMKGELAAYGFKQGGDLSITASGFYFYDDARTSVPEILADKPYQFIENDFFAKGGFSGYQFTATTLDAQIATGTIIDLRNSHWRLLTDSGWVNQAQANGLAKFVTTEELPAADREAVDFSLTVEQGRSGRPVLQQFSGSQILGQPGASISLKAANDMFIDGAIKSPGGKINLSLGASATYINNKALVLGNNALLDVSGSFEKTDPTLRDTADYLVYGDGRVAIDVKSGYLLAEKNALIDISGNALSDTVKSETGRPFLQELVATAGELWLTVSEAMLFDARVDASAAKAKGAEGGSLFVTQDFNADRLGADRLTTPVLPIASTTLQLQNGDIDLLGNNLLGRDDNGQLVSVGNVYQRMANDLNLTANTSVLDSALLQNSGFSSLSLRATNTKQAAANAIQKFGRITFADDMQLQFDNQLILDSATLDIQGKQVDLRSSYLQLGNNDANAWQRQSDSFSGGTGLFTANANFIDLTGNLAVRGTNNVSLLSASDLRLRGSEDLSSGFVTGQLRVADQLTLQADQIYPVTLSSYDITTGNGSSGKISILPGNTTGTQALSVGGKLTLNSAEIIQAGTLKAPLGEITLNADKLTLASGSLTSLALDAAMLPFGRIENGTDWIYQTPNRTLVFSMTPDADKGEVALPQKILNLNADEINFAEGATIDARGGGDLFAFEWISGPGGSKDVLSSTYGSGSFAIVPASGLDYAPWDYLENNGVSIANGQTFTLSTSVQLAGGTSVAAGTYAVLPSRYALMPGAFLVTPTAINRLQAGESIRQSNRSPIVAGRLGVAGTDIVDSQYSGFVIDPVSLVRERSEYDIRFANSFFADSSLYQKPEDGGDIAFTAIDDLQLGGALLASGAATATTTGRGGILDIQVDQLRILAEEGTAKIAGVIDLLDDQLNSLDVQSLLLGGKRQRGDENVEILVGAETVEIVDNVNLLGREIIAVGSDRVTIGDNVAFTGRSPATVQSETELQVDGDAALFAVSQASDVVVRRENVANPQEGDLSIGTAVSYTGFNSLAFDVSRNLQLDSLPNFSTGNLAIGAPAIRIGGGTGNGLTLDSALLNQLDVAGLTLRSGTSLDIYGDVQLDLNSFTIDAAGIRQFGNNNTFAVNAKNLILDNRYERTASGIVADNNQLQFTTETLQFGTANNPATVDFRFDGVNNLALSASKQVVNAGQIRIDAGETAVMSIATPLWRGVGGSNVEINAGEQLSVSSNGIAAQTVSGLGDRLSMSADTLSVDTRIVLPSGVIELNSIGLAANDDLQLGSNAVLDVSGVSVAIGPKTVNSDAGSISLRSDSGNIIDSAQLRLNGAADTKAGRLDVSAANGAWLRNGAIAAQSTRQDRAGELTVDLKTENNFSGLIQIVNSSFDRLFDYRQRQGDVTISSNKTLKSQNLFLTADNGSMTVAGLLDARGLKGGDIALHASNNIIVNGDIKAGAYKKSEGIAEGFTNEQLVQSANGGDVLINSTGGEITLTSEAGIDLAKRGIDRVKDGELRLRATRTTNDVPVTIDGQLDNIGSVVIEAVKHYSNQSVVDVALLDTIKQDMQDFWTNAGASVLAKFNNLTDPSIGRLEVAADISNSGDITIADAVDTSQWRFGDNSDQVGNITFRAGGNLLVNNNINDGMAVDVPPPGEEVFCGLFYDCANPKLQTDDSFGFRLTAGADISSANVFAIENKNGDVIVANANPVDETDSPLDLFNPALRGYVVRTGTGDLSVIAGGNILLNGADSAIYTMGRATPIQVSTANGLRGFPVEPGLGVNYLDLLYLPATNYPVDGGDLTLRAGGDIAVVNDDAVRYARDVNGNVLLDESGAAIRIDKKTPFVTDWLHRIGDSKTPATWAVDILNFRHGAATLGGGDLSVNAGNTIANMAIASATTGKQVGDFDFEDIGGGVFEFTEIRSNVVDVQGGGDVSVRAGGDISDLSLTTMRGNADVISGGDILVTDASYGNLFAIGDASLTINALGDVNIGSIFNPTAAPQSQSQLRNDPTRLPIPVNISSLNESYFFTYSDQTEFSVNSLSGDIVFADSINSLMKENTNFQYLNAPTFTADFFATMPSNVNAAALQGDIVLERNITLMPSAGSSLQLLAKNNLVANSQAGSNQIRILLPDGDPAALPYLNSLSGSLGSITAGGVFAGTGAETILLNAKQILGLLKGPLFHASQPLHSNDDKAVELIAGTGDIGIEDGEKKLTVDSSKRVFAYAGNNLVNTSFSIQHARDSDISVIQTDNDISFVTPRSNTGVRPSSSTLNITIAGPGALQVLAGGDVNLGVSDGIVTTGDQSNSVLADNGADVTVAAGLTDFSAGVNAYETRYLDGKKALVDFVTSSRFAGDVSSAVTTVTGLNVSSDDEAKQALLNLFAQPSTRSQALNLAQTIYDQADLYSRLEFVVPQFLNEIKQGGIESITGKFADPVLNGFARSFAAIDTLFAKPGNGTISLTDSKIQTQDGGDIRFLIPGGEMDVGLAAGAGIQQGRTQGIIASGIGAIEGYAIGSINVNRSRIFALDGGDVMLFSRKGDIDAGRGATTVQNIPPPVFSFDENGNAVVTTSAALTGSGILAGCYSESCKAGDVALFAPEGEINAGDAGIRSEGQVLVSAPRIVGAEFITAVGGTVGAPAAPAGDVSIGGVGDVASSATKSATDSAENSASNFAEEEQQNAAILTIDILGSGSDEDQDGVEDDEKKAAKKQPRVSAL